jgi:transcriptional regulator with XRE-family HTH domain
MLYDRHMNATFAHQIRFYIKRRNLPVEQLATLANVSRKTLYRWVNGEVTRPRHWYQIVAMGKALRLNVDEVNQLLWMTKYPNFQELKELARYEYELDLLDEFAHLEPSSNLIPRPQVHYESWAALEAPVGAVRPDSPFYVERIADSHLRQQLSGQGTTTTIQAGRQTGKTSLLMHAFQVLKSEQCKIIYLDFHLVDDTSRADLSSFLQFLSEAIAEQLDLEWEVVDRYWVSPRNPAQTFSRFLQVEVLQPSVHQVLLAIDEADVLLDTQYKKHFFALLRAWDSRRAYDTNWRKLNLVVVISTHPYLLIDDVNLSPFNVGLNIQLKDFNIEQVIYLNQRHGYPLKPDEIPTLIALVGGHPYLVRQAYYTLVSEGLCLQDLLAGAASPDGPFGRHLHFYQHSLAKSPALLAAFRQVLQKQHVSDESLLDRLSAVGLIKRDMENWKARCSLYENYFGRQLL